MDKRNLKVLLAVGLALGLGGCANVQNAVTYLASPQFTTAVGNVSKLSQVISCGVVVPTAALAQQIVTILGTDKAAVDASGKAYAISLAICNSISTMVKAQSQT